MRRITLPEPAYVTVDVADQLIAVAESLIPKNWTVAEDPELLHLSDYFLQRLVRHLVVKSSLSDEFQILDRNAS